MGLSTLGVSIARAPRMTLYLLDRAPHFDMLFISYFVFVILVARLVIHENHQRVWIMSAFATSMMALCGSVEVFLWIFKQQSFSSTAMSNMLLEFLKSYLITDLIYCGLWHPGQLGLLDGWIHHLVYIVVAEKLQQNYAVNVTQPLWVMEIPAAIRAWRGLGAIRPMIADRWFGPTFVAFRIVWPTYVMTQLVTQDWVFLFLSGIIVTHSFWAYKNLWC